MVTEIKKKIHSLEKIIARWDKLSLGPKVQITIALVLVALLGISMLFTMYILMRSFNRFEEHDIKTRLSSASLLISEQLASLGNTCQDYAFWDDTVNFIYGGKPDYVQVNITPETFHNIDIDLFLILNIGRQVVHHAMLPDKVKLISSAPAVARYDRLADIPADVVAALSSHRGLDGLERTKQSIQGVVAIGSMPCLVSASAVLPTSNNGPARGILIMARFLDPERMAKYRKISQTDLRLQVGKRTGNDLRPGKSAITISGKFITATRLLEGLDRERAFRLTIRSRRNILSQLRVSESLFFINLLVMAAACVGVVGFIIHRFVVRRINDFAQRADEIRGSPEHVIRMPLKGNDELDRLGMAMNDMLDELKSINDQVRHDALHDALTGLGNRLLLMDRLEMSNALLKRDTDYKFALYLFDLDGFKDINDGFGHDAGDQVLRVVAERLKNHLRESDTIVRLGGDEFVILQTDVEDFGYVEQAARKILALIQEPVSWENQLLQITGSVGILMSIDRCVNCTAQEYLRDVDISMYAAKRAGKNQFNFFKCDQRNILTRHISVLNELRSVAERGELEAWYQPIFGLLAGRMVGLEALVRWNHPDRGLISPDNFIPVAEESNIISEIDRWMLRISLQGLARLREHDPHLHVSVNFSVRQMMLPNVAEIVDEALRESGMPPESLNIELTETALARNEVALSENMKKLTERGVSLHLDDFGTGYSSLGRLRSLPVRVIKIDRSFINRIEMGDHAIVEAVINMSHTLYKEVVAEGVETEKQADILKALECDYMQGYFFSKPMREEDVIKFIKKYLARRHSVSG